VVDRARFILHTLILTCILYGCAVGAMEHIDGVAAVVGDDIVLLSELEAYMLLRLNSLRIAPDSADHAELRERFLDELIDGKVLLVHAKKDSTISVKNQDVETALEAHLARLMAENGLSPQGFEAELKSQGMSLPKFKAQPRRGIREQLFKQKVQQQHVATLELKKRDVEAFYEQYKDSLPSYGESVRLRKLVIDVAPPDSVRQTAFERIERIKTRLDNGEGFADLARQFSDDPGSVEAGDLGFIAKGTLNELAFEEQAFSLNPGEISAPFESRLGFHIITVVAKKNQMVHVRQIFIRVAPPEQTLALVEARLDSIRGAVSSPEAFSASVKAFSTEALSRSKGGDIGWLPLTQLPSAHKSAFDSLVVGAISKPLRDNNTFTLLIVADKVDSRALTLQDDWSVLAEKAKDIFAQQKLIDLVKKWREEVFIDIRL
jgi:peptidyl-prolyl cis-trans isomerase SurA